MMKKILLWLDDYRNPFNKNIDWMVFSPIGRDVKVIWVKNYNEFITYISENGLPDGICFDHDLADEHYRESMYDTDNHYSNYYNDGTFQEKTGYDCAKWLTNYCMLKNYELPSYNVHSANPVGKQNIISVLETFKKIQKQNLEN